MIYSALAPIYDRIMSHVEYDRWLELIQRIGRQYDVAAGASILEIGAGTGMLGSLLKPAGFDYTGTDLSFSMCRQAHKRTPRTVCADGRDLPFKKTFDLILFLYDGINYLHTPGEYTRLFAGAHRLLKPGGLFLFDITTRTNSLRYFTDMLDNEDFGDTLYIRHSHFDPRQNIQYNDFTIFTEIPGTPGHFVRSREHHAQKLFPALTVRKMVPPELFTVLGMWDGYTTQAAGPSSERVHFLLRRGEAP